MISQPATPASLAYSGDALASADWLHSSKGEIIVFDRALGMTGKTQAGLHTVAGYSDFESAPHNFSYHRR